MQEIASGIYYEQNYPGVTLGALALSRGTVMIDAPLRAEDGRSWRAALLNRNGGIERLLVNLDAHPDRTIGARSLECSVIAHQRTAQIFRSRSTTFKGQSVDAGAEWETCTDLGSSRWAIPDLTFSRQLELHWDPKKTLVLEHHPGPAAEAVWAIIPQAGVIFVGDAVLVNQPPFIATADLVAWLETLQELLNGEYQGYTLVSGRGGPVSVKDVHAQRELLEEIDSRLSALGTHGAPPEETEKLIPSLLSRFKSVSARRDLFENRLRYGLYRYYNRRFRPNEEPEAEGE